MGSAPLVTVDGWAIVAMRWIHQSVDSFCAAPRLLWVTNAGVPTLGPVGMADDAQWPRTALTAAFRDLPVNAEISAFVPP